MRVSVGSYEFDEVRYDSECDVLCLRQLGSRGTTADIFHTPEGHLVYLDDAGAVTGITLIEANGLLERDGKVPVTLPSVIEPDADHLTQALAG
jgi:uncharacterized protein YuzE